MAPSVLALIGATIVFSSFLSGVFGMAGGMILLGVLLNYFDVATGMILFSIIQLFANGWRVVQWRMSAPAGCPLIAEACGIRAWRPARRRGCFEQPPLFEHCRRCLWRSAERAAWLS
jgi:hypothetical protein